jgi:hypothetical protein
VCVIRFFTDYASRITIEFKPTAKRIATGTRALLLPGALLMAVGAQLFAPLMFVNF